MINIGIIGGGFVGKATYGFKSSKVDIKIYDLCEHLCVPIGTTIQDIYKCDLVFVAVPTPMDKLTGSCHYKIVENVVLDLKKNGVKHIVIRSTIPVGKAHSLGVNFMPEFLTEKNWKKDFEQCPTWVIGVDKDTNNEFVDTISTVIKNCKEEGFIQSDDIMVCSTKEAELIKYTRNCFLATKVAFFNEIYSFCQEIGINFDTVRQGVVIDSRIGPSHSKVPNEEFFNGRVALKKGAGGTCLPKDTSSLIQQFKLRDIPAPVLNAVQYRNTTIDRPEQDWKEDQGRAVI